MVDFDTFFEMGDPSLFSLKDNHFAKSVLFVDFKTLLRVLESKR